MVFANSAIRPMLVETVSLYMCVVFVEKLNILLGFEEDLLVRHMQMRSDN